ncbi:MAG: hypothetical protein EBY29_03195 [Planctomycetes bacterium]|nr:hypothetical protein [Planctomycetota bacterium]
MSDVIITKREFEFLTFNIKKLVEERDEARRELCRAQVNGQYEKRFTPHDIAKELGWDCFKETP